MYIKQYWFILNKLKDFGTDEIHNVYQKLRIKNDYVRNCLKCKHILFDYKYADPSQTKGYKIKTK